MGVASGIKTKEIIAGSGEIANQSDIVLTHIHGFLHRGEECLNTHAHGQPMRIDLSKRETVAGLRKGIEGMRVGGKREIVVSPHLAYGAEGVPGRIPPNAIIRFEVELLSILKAGEEHDHTTTLSVTVFHPGEAARNLARWQFGFGGEDPCGVIITCPRPGVTWRYAHSRPVELSFSPSERADLLHSVQSTLNDFPNDCLKNEEMWADASEKANSIPRDRRTNTLCVTMTIWRGREIVCNYALTENSQILLQAKFYQMIMRAIKPHLASGA